MNLRYLDEKSESISYPYDRETLEDLLCGISFRGVNLVESKPEEEKDTEFIGHFVDRIY